ncbi:MAG: beta-galactosidase [Pseudomonadota bacterium]
MKNKKSELGVCYYPEQWPDNLWADDAKKMADIGLSRVRIGEFAWSFIEPEPEQFEWAWLDRAIDTLAEQNLSVILGTPTATPPKWLVDAYPEILARDRDGRVRGFGSRRHYCFSSPVYRRETARIVETMAERYGAHDAVVAWQTDNEYGCHDTVRSYSEAARDAFREYARQRYSTIDALNEAWGCSFWSQRYRDFSEIELPNLTVTEPNPAHVLAFFRFSSDQVVSYNKLQTDILRRLSPGRDLLHNFMGFFFDFDHFDVSEDLDAVGWDSYPLGFLDVAPFPYADKERYLRQGHPDLAAFHHDLYRACGRGRWQIHEQQPGPVNWAEHNPAPLNGMVRLWTAEAFAHGAECVNYFRWRQAPFAQEQMHAGLERPNGSPAPAFNEAKEAAKDIASLKKIDPKPTSPVAIIFSYDAAWLFETQPQGGTWRYPAIVFEWYSALRRFGVDVDFIRDTDDFNSYHLIVCPSLPILPDSFVARCANSTAKFLFGPRTGSKTREYQVPPDLAPGALRELIPLTVTHSESLPEWRRENATLHGAEIAGKTWLDHVETELAPIAARDDGAGLWFREGRVSYLTTLPDEVFLGLVMHAHLTDAGVANLLLPPDLRIARTETQTFAFNYGPDQTEIPEEIAPRGGVYELGGDRLGPASFAVWNHT